MTEGIVEVALSKELKPNLRPFSMTLYTMILN